MNSARAENNKEIEETRKLREQIAYVEMAAKQHMTAEAVARYGNIKAAHPELAVRIAVFITQAVQSGQISGRISDENLKMLLMQMQPQKKEFRFVRR